MLFKWFNIEAKGWCITPIDSELVN